MPVIRAESPDDIEEPAIGAGCFRGVSFGGDARPDEEDIAGIIRLDLVPAEADLAIGAIIREQLEPARPTLRIDGAEDAPALCYVQGIERQKVMLPARAGASTRVSHLPLTSQSARVP